MTTIVAVKKNGKIGIGSDNLMVYGTCKENYSNKKNKKIKKYDIDNNICLVGLCGHASWGLLITNNNSKIFEINNIFEYVNNFHQWLKENYYLKNSIFENSLSDSFFHFIMIWKQQIFEINWNRNIINHKQFAAVGSGYSYALGSMHSTYHFKNIKDILEGGLYAASNFDAGTQKPFFIHIE